MHRKMESSGRLTFDWVKYAYISSRVQATKCLEFMHYPLSIPNIVTLKKGLNISSPPWKRGGLRSRAISTLEELNYSDIESDQKFRKCILDVLRVRVCCWPIHYF